MSNPSSETRELQVYAKRKRQSQGEIETLAHLTPVQESEDPMTAGTSTGGKNELKQHLIRNFISYVGISQPYRNIRQMGVSKGLRLG